jgi:Tol biopolymer transport system component
MHYRTLLPLLALLAILIPAPTHAAPWSPGRTGFADPAFLAQWSRTDAAQVVGSHGWLWGPQPWLDYYEFYRQSPNGLRLVQYFDKGRMELTDPSTATVTNGLLVVEMVTGYRQLGDNPRDFFSTSPAFIPIAGDSLVINPEAPTYAAFQGLISAPGVPRRDRDQRGMPVSATIDAVGNLGQRTDLSPAVANQTRGAFYNEPTGHTIPQIFWTFLNQRGAVLEQGRVRTRLVFDWVKLMGYPISDAYWVRTMVGGHERDVLVQLFERRTLTFTPSNPKNNQVEMGNVGQHYVAWRYSRIGQPWNTAPAQLPIFFASNRNGGAMDVFRMNLDGSSPIQQVATGVGESVPYSIRSAYGSDMVQLLIDSRRSDGTYRQLYAASYATNSDLIRLTYTDTTPPFAYSPYPPVAKPSNESNPAISPDGSKIAFVSDRTGKPQLFLIGYDGSTIGTVGSVVQLTSGECAHQTPAWSPDGRSLAWMEDCSGNFEVLRAELAYTQDSRAFVGRYYTNLLEAKLINLRQLSNHPAEDGFARFSPDGSQIVFQSRRDGGVTHIFRMNADGTNPVQLSNGPADDIAPVWSPDGSQIAFASIRDGDWEIERLDPDGTISKLTDNTFDDRWPVWAP